MKLETWFDPLYDGEWILSFNQGSWVILDPNGEVYKDYNPDPSRPDMKPSNWQTAKTYFEFMKYKQTRLYDQKRDERCRKLGTSLAKEDKKFREALWNSND